MTVSPFCLPTAFVSCLIDRFTSRRVVDCVLRDMNLRLQDVDATAALTAALFPLALFSVKPGQAAQALWLGIDLAELPVPPSQMSEDGQLALHLQYFRRIQRCLRTFGELELDNCAVVNVNFRPFSERWTIGAVPWSHPGGPPARCELHSPSAAQRASRGWFPHSYEACKLSSWLQPTVAAAVRFRQRDVQWRLASEDRRRADSIEGARQSRWVPTAVSGPDIRYRRCGEWMGELVDKQQLQDSDSDEEAKDFNPCLSCQTTDDWVGYDSDDEE
jgi:hypothetical protein